MTPRAGAGTASRGAEGRRTLLSHDLWRDQSGAGQLGEDHRLVTQSDPAPAPPARAHRGHHVEELAEEVVDHALDASDIDPGGKPVFRTGVARIDATVDEVRRRFPHLLRYLRLIGYVAAVATVAFVGYRASDRMRFHGLSWGKIAGGVGCSIVFWLALARGWSSVSGATTTVTTIATWCKTQVLRYVPGGFLAPAARATSVAGRKRDKLAAIIGENVNQLSVAVAMGGGLRAIDGKPFYAPLVLAFGAPFLLHHVVRGRTSLTDSRIAQSMLWYILAFSAYAAAVLLAQAALGPTPHQVRIAGAALLAWAVGLVVIFAPGGVGAREAAYVGLVATALPVGLPSAGAVTARLVSIAAELLVLLAVMIPWRGRTRAPVESTPSAPSGVP